MTIIVARHSKAAGREQGHTRAQPYAGGTAQINPKRGRAVSRNSAAYQPLRMRAGGSDDRFLNRGGGAKSQFLPATPLKSAASQADTGAWSSVTTTLARLRCEINRAIKAARHLFALVKFCQEPASGLSKSFHSFSSAVVHAVRMAWSSKHEVHKKSASGAQSVE